MTVRQPAGATTRGFTLLEMLVVLLIIGLMTGLVAAVAMPDEHARLHQEAARLARLLELAGEEARLGGVDIAWRADARGYAFAQGDGDGGWTAVDDRDLFRPRALPDGIALAGLHIENVVATGPMHLQFSADDVPAVFRIELVSGRERVAIASSPVGVVEVIGGEDGDAGDVPR